MKQGGRGGKRLVKLRPKLPDRRVPQPERVLDGVRHLHSVGAPRETEVVADAREHVAHQGVALLRRSELRAQVIDALAVAAEQALEIGDTRTCCSEVAREVLLVLVAACHFTLELLDRLEAFGGSRLCLAQLDAQVGHLEVRLVVRRLHFVEHLAERLDLALGRENGRLFLQRVEALGLPLCPAHERVAVVVVGCVDVEQLKQNTNHPIVLAAAA